LKEENPKSRDLFEKKGGVNSKEGKRYETPGGGDIQVADCPRLEVMFQQTDGRGITERKKGIGFGYGFNQNISLEFPGQSHRRGG